MGFYGVSTKNRVGHLMERYGKICASDIEDCRQALEEPIEVDHPILVYFQWVEDAIHFEQDGKKPFTPAKIAQTAYHAVNKIGLYSLELKEWRKKSDGGQDLGQFQKSVTGVISQPGGGNQGHQQGRRITICKCDGIDRRGVQAHLNGGGG